MRLKASFSSCSGGELHRFPIHDFITPFSLRFTYTLVAEKGIAGPNYNYNYILIHIIIICHLADAFYSKRLSVG